ncbi:MAG: hypothetical protein ACLFTT_02705, partial [Candidatus Hydrogenedentota bacterium]
MNKIHFSNPVHLVNPVYFLQRSATFQDDTAKLLGRGAGQPPRSPISGGAMRACEKELDKLRNDLWVQFLYYRAVGEKVKQKGDCPRESASRDCLSSGTCAFIVRRLLMDRIDKMNKIHFSNPVHLVNPVYFLQRSATFQDDTAKLLGRGAGQPPRSPISGGAMRACEKELDKLRNDLWVQFLYYRAVGEKVKQKG